MKACNVKANCPHLQVNLTFLDKTHLEGYDAQDVVELGGYKVETRSTSS